MKLIDRIRRLVATAIGAVVEEDLIREMRHVDDEIADLRRKQKRLHKMAHHLYYPHVPYEDHPYNEDTEE